MARSSESIFHCDRRVKVWGTIVPKTMEAFRVSHLLENQEAEYFLEADQEVSVKDLCPVVYVHQLGSVSQSFNAFQSQHYSLEIKCSNP